MDSLHGLNGMLWATPMVLYPVTWAPPMVLPSVMGSYHSLHINLYIDKIANHYTFQY